GRPPVRTPFPYTTLFRSPARMRDFGRTMTLFRVECDEPHHGVAYEWFDYGQTVALLPLNEGRRSVVLTLPTHEMRRLLTLDDARDRKSTRLNSSYVKNSY